MPHWSDKFHLRGVVWVVFWELELCLEVAALTESVISQKAAYLPRKQCPQIPQSRHSTGKCCCRLQVQLSSCPRSVVLVHTKTLLIITIALTVTDMDCLSEESDLTYL